MRTMRKITWSRTVTTHQHLQVSPPTDMTDDVYVFMFHPSTFAEYVQFSSVALHLRTLTVGCLSVAGHPIGPPPSYPPPPVPAASQHHQNSSPVSNKATPAPTPPLHRNPTSPLPRKPQPAIPPPTILKDQPRGLPPPVPFAPHPHKLLSSIPPPPPPPSAKPVKGRWPSTEGHNKTEWGPPAAMVQSASTLPICDHLETSMSLNRPTFSPSNVGGSQSLDSYHKGVMGTHCIRPFPPPLHFTNAEVSSHRLVVSDSLSPSQVPISHLRPRSPPQGPPLIKTGLYNKPEIPKPPSVSAKPQLAAKFKQPRVPPQ